MLVGRSRELEVLRAAAQRALEGSGDVVALVGEPGIGKTRLADEFSRELGGLGLEVHWGRAWETGGAPAYFPWAEVLRSIQARRAGPALPEALGPIVAPAGPLALGESRHSDPDAARFGLFEGVLGALRRAARESALLIVLDDMHAADVPSLELLHFLARAVRSARLLLVPTWREAEARSRLVASPIARVQAEAKVLRLGRLGRADIAALLLDSPADMASDRGGQGDLPGELLARTDGNPLFVVEAVRLLVGGGQLADLPNAAGIDVMIHERIELLDVRARELLRVAALLGRELSCALTAEVLGWPVPEAEAVILGLSRAGIVERHPQGYRFAHVLIADALYAREAPAWRREQHTRAALALERQVLAGDSALLDLCVHHGLRAAAELPAGKLVAWAVSAAERARAQGACERAVEILEQALAVVAVAASERGELLLGLGWAAWDAGRAELARDAFGQARDLARRSGDAALLARAALGRGAEFVFGDVRDELVLALKEAIAALPPDAVLLSARLRARLASALTPGALAKGSTALAREAVAAVWRHEDDRAVLDVLVSAGAAFCDYAPPRERALCNEELIRRARRLGDRVLELRGLSRLVTDYIELGELGRADALARERDERARALELPRYQWQAPLYRSMRAMIEGRFDVCDAAVSEARAIAERARDENARRCIAIHQTWLLLLADRATELALHEPEVLRCTLSMPSWFGAMVTALVRAQRGDMTAARELGAQLSPELFDEHGTLAVVMLANLAVDTGDRRWHAELLERLSPLGDCNAIWGPFGLVCLPPIAAVIGRLEAALGRADAARAGFESALARSQRMGARAHEAWVRYWWGCALPDAAPEMLAAAGELGRSLGMREFCERVAARRSAAPAPASPSAPPPVGVPGAAAFSLRRAPQGWVIEHQGKRFELRALRGLQMIARLVECRGRELHVTELSEASPEAAGDAGELIDESARSAYQQRLHTLRDALEEAEALGQVERCEQVREEMAAIARELSRAVGKGGQLRRAGSRAERARVSVQHRIREAIRRVAELDPELGRHLDWAIRTGVFCSYDPERRPR